MPLCLCRGASHLRIEIYVVSYLRTFIKLYFLYLPCVEPPRYEEPPPPDGYDGVERYVELPLEPLLRYVEPPLRDDEELLLPERYDEPLEGVDWYVVLPPRYEEPPRAAGAGALVLRYTRPRLGL